MEHAADGALSLFSHPSVERRCLDRIREISAARVEDNRLVLRIELVGAESLPPAWLYGIRCTVADPTDLAKSHAHIACATHFPEDRMMTVMTGPLAVPLPRVFLPKLSEETRLLLVTAAGTRLNPLFLPLLKAAAPR